MPVWDDLHKLKDALDGDEPVPAGGSKDQEEVRHEMHHETKKVEEIQKKEGWSDRIKDVLDGDDEGRERELEALRIRTEEKKAAAKAKIEEERGFGDKMHDLLDRGESKHSLEEAEFAKIDAEAEKERKRILGVRGGIFNVLDNNSNAGRPESGMKEKIKDLFGQRAEEKVAKEEGFTDKVDDFLHHDETKNLKQREKQRGWFADKINEMAGGGQRGELDEDKLDKTIDFFQKHVLKQATRAMSLPLSN